MAKFSKRHYEIVASVLAEEVEQSLGYITSDSGVYYDAINSTAGKFIRIFAEDNPAFDEIRFLQACGLDL